jgi:lincosamide nucleotidyltransferase A/C/D/E
MDASAAVELLRFLDRHGMEITVDGGWAVDALVGEQTRPHDDLDIAIPHNQVATLRSLLAARGYTEQLRPDTWECNFVLADENGNRLDVHSYTFEPAYGIPYKPEHLTGKGIIHGYPVRTITPEWLVKFHLGYEPDDHDRHDVRLLCERFGIPVPAEYRSR